MKLVCVMLINRRLLFPKMMMGLSLEHAHSGMLRTLMATADSRCGGRVMMILLISGSSLEVTIDTT